MASKVMSFSHGYHCDCERCDRCNLRARDNGKYCTLCIEWYENTPKAHCRECHKCKCCACKCI